MDPNFKDELRDRRREEALVRRLGEALDRTAPREGEPCPDAELIAAFHERSLGPEETDQCEVHFAACSRCRKILSVLAASDDTPLAEKEVARLGVLVAAARAPQETTSSKVKPIRLRGLDWRTRWLAPALGVAAVLAVWFAMRPPWRTADQGSSSTLIAQAPESEVTPNTVAPAPDEFSNTAPKQNPETPARTSSALSKDRSVLMAEAPKPAAEASPGNRVEQGRATGGLATGAAIADSASGNEKKEQAEINSRAAAAPPPVPPKAAVALSGRAEARAQDEVAPAAPPSAMAAVEEPQAKSAANTSADAPAREKRAPQAQDKIASAPPGSGDLKSFSTLGAAGTVGVQIRSLSGKILWRAGKNGLIQRSTNSGQTWSSQTSPVQEDWLAGAAASDTICWIVGRNGAIARTIDGEHWEKIVPPSSITAAQGNLPDWTSVTANSALAATITTSDGRRFTTQDSGKTWRAP